MTNRTAAKSSITVTVAQDSPVEFHGSVVKITGTGPEGQPVAFGADWRVAQDVLARAETFGECRAVVEPWQIIVEGF